MGVRDILLFVAWGAAMAALVGIGTGKIVYRELKLGIPMLVAGLVLYAALWFDNSR